MQKFGVMLREMRAKNAITLRELSMVSDVDLGYLSRLERGSVPPPQKNELLESIITGVRATQEEAQSLRDQADQDNKAFPRDIADRMKEMEGVPLLLRTVANKELSKEELEKITEYIKEHY